MKHIVFTHFLNASSCISVLWYYLRKRDPIRILYFRATTVGVAIANYLHRIGIVSAIPECITPWQMDNRFANFLRCHHQVHEIIDKNRQEISQIIDRDPMDYADRIRVVNVIKMLVDDLLILVALRNYADYIRQAEMVSDVAIVSHMVPIYKHLDPPAMEGKIDLISCGPVNWMRIARWYVILLISPLIDLIRVLSPTPAPRSIGIFSAWGWGQKRFNDFFWFPHCGIDPDQVFYLYERPDNPLSHKTAEEVLANTGAKAVALATSALCDSAEKELLFSRRDIVKGWKTLFLSVRTMVTYLFALRWRRVVHSKMLHHDLYYEFYSLQAQLASLGIRSIFHYQESNADFPSLAAEESGAIRVGYHWSCLDTILADLLRTHHVYFTWGLHDANICVGMKSITPYLLIAGCPINEMVSSPKIKQKAQMEKQKVADRGAECTIVLFDTSILVPDFYRFFLERLLEEPRLGLLIKSKSDGWERIQIDGLCGLVDAAYETGRVGVLDSRLSPSDAGSLSDFSVGIGSISAIITAAIEGNRALYISYEHEIMQLQSAYATLENLGEDRCIFPCMDSLYSAICRYIDCPSNNPTLGDISPVIDQFDPFRDGKASLRIGQYVGWYHRALSEGYNRDMALKNATMQYAEEWGNDKVVRGI